MTAVCLSDPHGDCPVNGCGCFRCRADEGAALLTRQSTVTRSLAGPQRRWLYTLTFPEPDDHGFTNSQGTKDEMLLLAKRRGWDVAEA